jgi:Fur family transcriptional regulator, ferric uptake regulator
MDALRHFQKYLGEHGVRHSKKRMQVFTIFVACEQHLTVIELVELVHKKFPKIGIATVYRTLKLIADAGIARAVEFGDGTIRYEHDFGHEHHDHLVCTGCGSFREINNACIEEEQQKIADREGFLLLKHKMILYGICPKCSMKK